MNTMTQTQNWENWLAPYQQQFTDMMTLLERFPRAQICESEKEAVFAQDKMTLYHYKSLSPLKLTPSHF